MGDKRQRKRLPRYQRVPENERPNMVLTDRDRELIAAVNDYRVLLGTQLEALFFGSRSTAQYRLSRLFQHEFLDRHFLPVVSGGPASSPIVYTLGARGRWLLVHEMGYTPKDVWRRTQPSWKFIAHQLEINDVRIAITVACRQPGFALAEWLGEAVFRAEPEQVSVTDSRGRQVQKPVLPDGYFVIDTPPGRAHFFLEVDRGTEPHHKFAPQVAVYEAYTHSGQYQARFAARSLRILVVTSTPQRLKNLKATTRKAGGDRKYQFATLSDISAETVLTAPIWQRLTDGTPVALVPGLQ